MTYPNRKAAWDPETVRWLLSAKDASLSSSCIYASQMNGVTSSPEQHKASSSAKALPLLIRIVRKPEQGKWKPA